MQSQLSGRRERVWESSCGLCRVGDGALSVYVGRRHPLWDRLSPVGIGVGHGLPRGLGRRRQVTHPVLCVPWWESREICPRGAGNPSGPSDGPPVSLTFERARLAFGNDFNTCFPLLRTLLVFLGAGGDLPSEPRRWLLMASPHPPRSVSALPSHGFVLW